MFCDYSMLITLYKIGELHFRLLDMTGFLVKAKNERFPVAGLRCRQNLHVVVWQTISKNCIQKRAARAAQLFFLIQPIKSYFCGVGITIAVVIS